MSNNVRNIIVAHVSGKGGERNVRDLPPLGGVDVAPMPRFFVAGRMA